MKHCDGCGEKATTECPYCKADACDDCIPICEHDARKVSESGTAPTLDGGQ